MFQQVGYFYNVESTERPVSQMRKILVHFTELDQNKTILSEVHSDFINKGMLTHLAYTPQYVLHSITIYTYCLRKEKTCWAICMELYNTCTYASNYLNS